MYIPPRIYRAGDGSMRDAIRLHVKTTAASFHENNFTLVLYKTRLAPSFLTRYPTRIMEARGPRWNRLWKNGYEREDKSRGIEEFNLYVDTS